ncbi:MAG TPA: hypothetical protein VKA89_03505 [Solirubrobacterales bacterium]|nr:hypothetical protein [Solirubrobacterales bacterium]
MAKRSLRPQLNQIRAWVRQGRTDAWIAHQLEVGASELREFRRQHGLSPDEDDSSAEVDLRDEIEAEIEAATAEEEAQEAEEEPEDESDEDSETGGDEEDGGEAEGRPRRRRRRGRRGGRGRKRDLEGTFDHGDEGYGLWLDPAVTENPVYSEHWAGHRAVAVRIEPDQIVISRVGDGAGDGSGNVDVDDDVDDE